MTERESPDTPAHLAEQQRRQAEQALRRSEARLRAVVQTAVQVLWTADVNGEVVQESPQWRTFSGQTFEEARASGWLSAIHPDDREHTRAAWASAVASGTPCRIEHRVRNPDNEWRHVVTQAVPVRDENGQVCEWVGACTDVTERVRAEAERRDLEARLRQAQKLESLSVLAGGIAHDFNNILTSVLGHTELALVDLPADSPARPHVEQAAAAARRAAELTAQMLAYSGKGKFVVRPVHLSGLVQEIARFVEVSLPPRCALRCEFTEPQPSVHADATQLRQIVLNLLLNAVEAVGDSEGTITLRTGVTTCDRAYLSEGYLDADLPEGRYVYLEVADSGCGMTEETRQRIFEPFFSTKFTGRGMGLAAVLGIVRGHRGALKVASEPGRGTTVRVLFPAATAGGLALPAKPPAASPPTAAPGRKTILIVDDEEAVCRLARAMLERLGYAVLVATGGRPAVEMVQARASAIDAVLLDVTMPGLDGAETFHELRRLGLEAPVILSSGYSAPEASARFPEQGVAAFIQKPYRMAELSAVLYQVLGLPSSAGPVASASPAASSAPSSRSPS